MFDTRLQNREMTFSEMRGERRARDDLIFKTIDGNDIGLDVIIAYRIDADKGSHILRYVTRNDALAEAVQGKRIILLPVSEGGMNLKTTDINRLIQTLGVESFSVGK